MVRACANSCQCGRAKHRCHARVRDVHDDVVYRVELFRGRLALLDLLVRSGRYELASAPAAGSSLACDTDDVSSGKRCFEHELVEQNT